PGRARGGQIPRRRRARDDGAGPELLDGPCDLARRRLPRGHVRPAGSLGIARPRRLAHPRGRRHAAAVVLGAVPALPARRDRARRAARLLPSWTVRPRRGRPLHRHLAEGAADQRRLPGLVRSVRLRPGAGRADACLGGAGAAAPTARPVGPGERPAPPAPAERLSPLHLTPPGRCGPPAIVPACTAEALT